MVPDPEPQGIFNPWRTYLACLERGADLTEPFVILQDDCLPVPGFVTAAKAVRAARPNAILAFALQGVIHQATRSEFWRSLERGDRLMRIYPHNWVPALALGWTPELAGRALEWDAQQTGRLRENYTSDDGRLFYFVRWARVEVWATVPCLVDHPDDVPTVGSSKKRNGHKPSRRTLQLLEGDAAEWGRLIADGTGSDGAREPEGRPAAPGVLLL